MIATPQPQGHLNGLLMSNSFTVAHIKASFHSVLEDNVQDCVSWQSEDEDVSQKRGEETQIKIWAKSDVKSRMWKRGQAIVIVINRSRSRSRLRNKDNIGKSLTDSHVGKNTPSEERLR